MSDKGVPVIIAAVILSLSMVGGAYMVSGSIDRVSAQIPEFETALKNIQTAVATGAGKTAAAPAAPTRRRGPDPAKVYKLASTGAPTKGPDGAKVTLVEFSDFQ